MDKKISFSTRGSRADIGELVIYRALAKARDFLSAGGVNGKFVLVVGKQ